MSSASTGLCGGRRVTVVPTATGAETSGPGGTPGAPGRWMPLAKRVEMSLWTPDVARHSGAAEESD